MQIWYWIDVGTACGGIVVRDGVVVDSAPYFRYLRGKRLCDVRGKLVRLD